jgi:NAD-dependent dihydropyrimidine dehydrogenase PreA subunit
MAVMMRYLRDVVTLELDAAKCTGCGMCLEVCPRAVFEMRNGKAQVVDRDACIECGACETNCQAEAISVESGVGCARNVIKGLFGKKSGCCSGNKSCC